MGECRQPDGEKGLEWIVGSSLRLGSDGVIITSSFYAGDNLAV